MDGYTARSKPWKRSRSSSTTIWISSTVSILMRIETVEEIPVVLHNDLGAAILPVVCTPHDAAQDMGQILEAIAYPQDGHVELNDFAVGQGRLFVIDA